MYKSTTRGVVALLSLMVVISGCTLFSPSMSSVKGTVSYTDDGGPVIGAQVFLAEREATTDEAGGFSFDRVRPGSYNISVFVDGESVYAESIEVASRTRVVNIDGVPVL